MRTERLKDYYKSASRRQAALEHVTLRDLDIVQFGVFSGASMAYIHEYYKEHSIPYGIMWGFDSFEGLPDEQKGIQIHQDWSKGSFDARKWFGLTPTEIIDRLYADFDDFGMKDKVVLRPGFFDTSLNAALGDRMNSFSFIDVDCDLYISAYQALDWIFRNKLAVPGTIIYYDDWADGQRCNGGEHKAHHELVQKYGVRTKLLYEGANVAFKVISIGD
jgi:hypothetical protein